MKNTIKKYIITDLNNKLFWVNNKHYGYGFGNKAIFETKFTENLTEASLMSKEEAEGIIERFTQFDCVSRGGLKVDSSTLLIKKL